MNALKYAAAVVGTAIAAVAISAPAAHADTQDFLYDVQSQGWYANRGDSVLVANGFKVCRMLNSATGDVVAEYVYENTPSSVSRREGEVVFPSVNPGIGKVGVVLDLLGFALGELFVGERGEFGEFQFKGGGGDGLIRVHIGGALGEFSFGFSDGSDGILFDGLCDATGADGVGNAVKETLPGAQDYLLRLAEGAPDFDAT